MQRYSKVGGVGGIQCRKAVLFHLMLSFSLAL